MAKVIAPFQIEGTLDDLNFYLDENKINRVRTKGESSMTTERYQKDPSFHKMRMQNQEFAQCATIAKTFRLLALQFNKRAKNGSYAGRTNKLLIEILQNDPSNELGARQFKEGIKTKNGQEQLVGFESNILRPLPLVLKKKKWTIKDNTFHLPKYNLATDIEWPEDATHITFCLAIANWNIETNHHTTHYAEPQLFSKLTSPQDITIPATPPTDQDLHLTFVFIGFSKQIGSKHIPLHRKHNTATLIAYHYFPQHLNDNTPAQTETPAENLKPPFTFS